MTNKPIDWLALLKLTNNRPELAKELLNMFAVELPVLRSAINTAHDNNDWREMKSQVHKLHGSCCYTGVPDLKNLSQQLEESLKLKNHDATKTFLAQLNSEIDRVLQTIKQETYIDDSH